MEKKETKRKVNGRVYKDLHGEENYPQTGFWYV